MPPVFGPVSPSPTRLWSCADARATAVSPSTNANRLASSPARNSSITKAMSPAVSIAASASSRDMATVTPLPAASPSAFTTTGIEKWPSAACASATRSTRTYSAVGMRFARQRSLVKPFEPSSRAAAASGPNTAIPAARRASATPATRGASGPMTTRSTPWFRANSTTATGSHGSISTHSAQRDMPGLPGAAVNAWQLGDCLSRHASASSRPPDPNSRIFMDLPDDTRSGLLANVAPGDNSPALTVSELSGALKRTIESAFGQVRVRGEISGFKRHASGHCYFTLKDESACIDAVIWRTSTGALAFRPEDGAEVIATGRLTTYPGRSKYQIVVDRMELAGEGALLALLEKRRKALAAEGLFAPERKRKLPFLPRVIGVVTSPTGAVIRDILHRLEDRCPTRVILWPVPVQGEGAAAKVAAAIRASADLDPRPDVLIVARGGGSIEDLWAFNEEEVVRAAADSPIPLISAVGHETDTTLIDHAADRRAPTPTAAAEIAVPVRSELLGQLGELAHRAQHCLSARAERCRERFDLTVCRWPEPQALFAPAAQRIDDISDRLPRALASRAGNARADLNGVAP